MGPMTLPLTPDAEAQGSSATAKPRQVSALLHPLAVGSAPLLWKDWDRRRHRRACMHLLPHQRVDVHVESASPPRLALSPPILSRAQHAHARLSWEDRLTRNGKDFDVWSSATQTLWRPRSLCDLAGSGDNVTTLQTSPRPRKQIRAVLIATKRVTSAGRKGFSGRKSVEARAIFLQTFLHTAVSKVMARFPTLLFLAMLLAARQTWFSESFVLLAVSGWFLVAFLFRSISIDDCLLSYAPSPVPSSLRPLLPLLALPHARCATRGIHAILYQGQLKDVDKSLSLQLLQDLGQSEACAPQAANLSGCQTTPLPDLSRAKAVGTRHDTAHKPVAS
jgi:hypothetical protein